MASTLRLSNVNSAAGLPALDIDKIASNAGRYIRQVYAQVDTTSFTSIGTSWTLGPSFANTTGFKAGSLVRLDYHMPCRNDSTSWGGLYIEPQISYNAGMNWFSLGSSGYDGNVMNNASADIASYFNSILIDPGQTSDFGVQVRFYVKSYDGTAYINYSHDINLVSGTATALTGNNFNQHYSKIIVEELAILRGSS